MYISSHPRGGRGGQWRFWSDCANAQADLNLHWAHMSEYSFLTWQLIFSKALTNALLFYKYRHLNLYRTTFYFYTFIVTSFKENNAWHFRRLTWNIKSYFLWKEYYIISQLDLFENKSQPWATCRRPEMSLRKQAYSNMKKISPPKTESFQIKKLRDWACAMGESHVDKLKVSLFQVSVQIVILSHLLTSAGLVYVFFILSFVRPSVNICVHLLHLQSSHY